MNKNQIIIIALCTFLFSCREESKELKELIKQREEISKSIDKKNEELEKINQSIAKLQKVDDREIVKPFTINYQPFQHIIVLQSNVSTEQDVMIYPEFMGTLTWHVKEGQRVAKGQVIGSINDGGISSQLKQAQIQTELAKTAYEKQSRLWNEKIGSEIQFLQAKTNYEAAQKSISAIQSQLGKTKIRAPFSGTIDNLLMQSGQAVAPGIPLAKIVNVGNLKVTADVSEQYISSVKLGTLANIELASLQELIQGRVSRISNAINPSNRTFSIEIPVPNKNGIIKPNMTAKINLIDYQNPNAIVVPNTAIHINANGEKFVYLLTKINGNSAVAKKTIIQIGKSNNESTEVLVGLNAGDKIIHEGSKSVVDNSKIKF